MKFLSTRDASVRDSFERALLLGYALGGGLYMPETIPSVSASTLQQWSTLSFPDLAFEIFSLFLSEDDIPATELRALLHRSFSRFPDGEVAPVATVGDASTPIAVTELYHGPTLAFKDIGLQIVGNFLQHYLQKNNDTISILIATTGDTGTAAAEACRGQRNINFFCLYPTGNRCSPVQYLQMTRCGGDNIRMIAVDGDGDELDVPVKQLFKDQQFRDVTKLCCINSVNIGRVLAQTVHYFWSHFRLHGNRSNCQSIFAVPSGALGNVAAALLAKHMGLPCQITACNNSNGQFAHFVLSGLFRAAPVVGTVAPAMDQSFPYNIERVLYLIAYFSRARDTGAATTLCRQWMEHYEEHGVIELAEEWQSSLREELFSASVSDDDITATVRHVHARFHYVLDPHTAVAFTVALRLAPTLASGQKLCVISTASPYKCLHYVEQTLGVALPPHPLLTRLATEPDRSIAFSGRAKDCEPQLRSLILSSISTTTESRL
eukprot:gnl/Spiro4/24323_TR12081_c0_g1_i1.p1 gnl/Spiro4/24323_TR12081_c0_g1~~gnl/Spiro4/24323_TR12081_c0_g1_i1.p1  ORF type:complete len:491 (-),score=131.65 gnl/Spiro4/24323_TR12081_c0_g1_i1:246-1718(-)